MKRARARVHNSPPAGAPELARPRGRVSRTKPRRRHGGGRPESFIAAVVVAEAARLYAVHRRWSDVLQALERGGNGTYARNTLIRRVRKYSRVHKSPTPAPAGAR